MVHDGSSPRLRGTCIFRRNHLKIARFIPAPAGNIVPVPFCAWSTTVHPRACGEHVPVSQRATHTRGSSPRLRGTSMRAKHPLGLPRFIPAPAGNILHRVGAHSFHPVHPRACGEHTSRALGSPCRDGSSPRLRGTLVPRNQVCALDRFIPAPAGNIACCSCSAIHWAVHPRACGEHNPNTYTTTRDTGSSPRLRGT